MKAPETLAEAQKISVCQQYENYHVCVFAGGGSPTHHDMFWAFVIFDLEGEKIHWGELPDCLDVDDGLSHCYQIIDRWSRGITYEDVALWRSICEYMNARYIPLTSHELTKAVPGCHYLVGYDRTHRQILWSLYKIQLIKFEQCGKHGGWILKGNWEDKIDFLEQVCILNRNPDTLPRPWLEKWERRCIEKERIEAERQKRKDEDTLIYCLRWLDISLEELDRISDEDTARFYLSKIVERSQLAKELLRKLYP